jgi:L,D-transpeptidase YcbB
MRKMTKRFYFVLVLMCFISGSFAQQFVLQEDPMVQEFYVVKEQKIFWFSSNRNIKCANEWLTLIELSNVYPTVSKKLQIDKIRTALNHKNMIDSSYKRSLDRQLTGLVLHYIKDKQQGTIHFDYDEISNPRDSVYVNQLLMIDSKRHISSFNSEIECTDPAYVFLEKYLKDSISIHDTLKYKAIELAMNYRLFFTLNHQSEYIVVNILSAEAEYYKNDNVVVGMRAVVGRKLNPTPVLASYITSIITFPYWNVPQSIAAKEILPKVQKDEKYLEQNDLEVVDAKGNALDESELKWRNFTEENFPYFFRQSTGNDNALGVLKFNLKNPYSIFLHATSNQAVFTRTDRFLSHGCIRLEKPFELANALLDGRLDVETLKAGKKDTESNKIMLPHKIPTFIIYMPIQFVGNNVVFLPDVYGLLQ